MGDMVDSRQTTDIQVLLVSSSNYTSYCLGVELLASDISDGKSAVTN